MVRTGTSLRKSLEFEYDAMGNRVAKRVYSDNTFSIGSLELITYYLRDASGNVMSIYEEDGGMLNLTEQHIYGSSRLGMRTTRLDMLTASTPVHTGVKEIIRGERRYELTAHLGNVLVVCSDQLTATDGDSNYEIDFYAAEVVSYSDYYPFGAPMIERISGESRYGFNGKEQDNEFSGEGNTYDFGARMYDGRLGRWWSVDPALADYATLSTYAYTADSPLLFFEIDGAIFDVSTLSEEERLAYDKQISILRTSRIFNYYYTRLENSSTVFTIKVEPERVGGGSYSTHTKTVTFKTVSDQSYVVAQELFHAYQSMLIEENVIYNESKTPPDSNIEAEGDLLSSYVVTEIGYLSPAFLWSDKLFEISLDFPTPEVINSSEFKSAYDKALDDRISYYTEMHSQGLYPKGSKGSYLAPKQDYGPEAILKISMELQAEDLNLVGPTLENGDFYENTNN